MLFGFLIYSMITVLNISLLITKTKFRSPAVGHGLFIHSLCRFTMLPDYSSSLVTVQPYNTWPSC